MSKFRNFTVGLLLLVGAASTSHATDINCKGPANVEEFRYAWRIRGGIRFIAGLMFPTSGIANLKTAYPMASEADRSINSELLITPSKGDQGFFAYESRMDESGKTTFMTYSGYAWGNKTRKLRSTFDYVKRLMRTHKETPKGVENMVKQLPAENMRDILTSIYYLRQNAAAINGPVVTTIFTDGQQYPATFRPGEQRTFVIDGKTVMARAYQIGEGPGGKKWPGAVTVWLSEDARRIPFRIEIQESIASLQLDLQSVESCAFLKASR